MNLNEFGLLVKALRHNSFDEFGNRLTRESLSERIHLTPHQLGRLERGDRKYLDSQTLQLLANSLSLTNLEKREFLHAAIGLANEESCDQGEPEIQLNNLIGVLENLQVPAYITDAFADMVAVNTANLVLHQITPEILSHVEKMPIGFNYMNYIYSPELNLKQILGESLWREAADMAMLLFRRSTLRYRHTEYYNFIMKELLKEKQFDIDWYSSHRLANQYDITYELMAYEHPCYGPLSYIATETVIDTVKGDLFLIIYNPADTETVSVFSKLLKENGNKAYRLAGWPEKKM